MVQTFITREYYKFVDAIYYVLVPSSIYKTKCPQVNFGNGKRKNIDVFGMLVCNLFYFLPHVRACTYVYMHVRV